jgi:hypothetical protein
MGSRVDRIFRPVQAFLASVFGVLSIISLLSLATSAVQAQEEGTMAAETSTSLEPPIAGAWAGSATANSFMEDGFFIPQRRNPWAVGWFNWATVNMRDFREGEGRLETYNYLSFDYRLNWESKISIRPEFYMSGSGNDFSGHYAEGETEMGDIYAQYFHSRLALIGDRVGLAGAFRVYLPNSDNSKRQKQFTRLNARLIFQAPLGNGFWLTYHFRPAYFVQTQKASQGEFFNTRANENYRLEQRLELSKIFTSRFGLHQEISVEHRRYYGSVPNDIEARTDGYFGMGTAASYYMGNVSFRGGVSYESKIAMPDRNPALYNDRDTKYYLMTTVRM